MEKEAKLKLATDRRDAAMERSFHPRELEAAHYWKGYTQALEDLGSGKVTDEDGRAVEEEGRIPEVTLPYTISIQQLSGLDLDKLDYEAAAESYRDLIMAILPQGAEYLGYEMVPVQAAVEIEHRFRHFALKDISVVKLEHDRMAVFEGNRIEEYQILKSIEYIKRGEG